MFQCSKALCYTNVSMREIALASSEPNTKEGPKIN